MRRMTSSRACLPDDSGRWTRPCFKMARARAVSSDRDATVVTLTKTSPRKEVWASYRGDALDRAVVPEPTQVRNAPRELYSPL